jgi:TP901 family phage tail tape measure protein
MPMNQFGAGFTIGATDAATPTINKVSGGMTRMFDTVQRRSVSFKEAWRGMQIGMTAIGGALARSSGMVGAFFDDAQQRAMAFGKGVAEVGTLVDLTKYSLDDIRRATMEAARAFGTPAMEQVGGLYEIISAGITDTAKAQQILTQANKLAIGGVTDTATAVDGLTTMMNAYSESGITATEVTDAMFQAIRIGKTTAPELARSIGRVASASAAVGVSADEMLGAIATMTTKGLMTSRAVTGLGQALSNIRKPTKEASDEAQRLHLQFGLGALQQKGFVGFLLSVSKAAKGSEESLTKLFGSSEAFNAITGLLAENGAAFAATMDEMRKKAGSTDAAFLKMTDTFAFQRARLSGLGDTLRISVGESIERILLPGLRLVNRALEAFVGFWDKLPPGARDSIVGIVMALAKFVGLVGGVMLAVGALGLFGVSLTGIVAGAAAFLIVGPLMISVFAGVAASLGGAILGIKAALGEGGTMEDAMRRIGLLMRGVVDLFREGRLSDAVQKELDKTENKGIRPLLDRFEGFLTRAQLFWKGLKEGFSAGIANLDFGPLKRSLDDLMGTFNSLGTENLDTVREGGINAGLSLAKMGQSGVNALAGAISAVQQLSALLTQLQASNIAGTIDKWRASFELLFEVVQGIAWALNIIKSTIVLAVETIHDLARILVRTVETVNAVISGPGGWRKVPEIWSREWGVGPALGELGRAAWAPPGAGPAAPTPAAATVQSASRLSAMMAEQASIREWIGGAPTSAGNLTYAEATPEMRAQYEQKLKELNTAIVRAVKEGVSGMSMEVDGYKFGKVVDKSRAGRAPLNYAEVGVLAGVGVEG